MMKYDRRGWWRTVPAIALVGVVASGAASGVAAGRSGFNHHGNMLIADQFNNRVVEVDSHHRVVFSFGNGSSVAGPHSIVGPNDAERVGALTLIAGTGTPPNADPSCTATGGCPDNRVILVNRAGHITWQYGQAGIAGSGHNQLNTPVAAAYLPNHDILITDQANERVIEVTPAKKVVWQYGKTGKSGKGAGRLNNPNSAELLANGHILIADENNNRVLEVTRTHHIVAVFTASHTVSGAAFASRLKNGDTLITDSNNNRIVEVNSRDKVVWKYVTTRRKHSFSAPLPTRAVRLANGDTLISDQFNDQVIEVTMNGRIVFTQGVIDPTNGPDLIGAGRLNGPYAAYAIGDFTGLTPPNGRFGAR